MTTSARIWELIEPALADAGYELVDVECVGLGSPHATVRVRVDRQPDPSDPAAPVPPVDLDAISAATRVVDGVLEAFDPVDGRYTLEVSSPGLERPLRTPAQFGRFVGTTVKVKTIPGAEGDRRIEGRLDAADDGGIVVAGRAVPYDQIERAHTVFVWGPAPKPTKGASGQKPGKAAARGPRRADSAPATAEDHEVNEVIVR